MELSPFSKVLWLLTEPCDGTTLVIRRLVIGVVVMANAKWPEVLPAEVDKFASDLDGCQIEEVPDAFNFDLVECPMQADHRVLEYVIRLLPSPKPGAAMKHASGKKKESITGMVEQMLLCSRVTL